MGNIVASISALLLHALTRSPKKPVDLGVVVEKWNPHEEPQKRPTKEELIDTARRTLDLDIVNHYNFAFVGQSGCGKSSLINALRMVEDDDPDAALVGEIETTKEIKKYIPHMFPHVALWDMPGIGTLKQRGSRYFDTNMLYAFDCILVLSADRFLEGDFEIAKRAIEYKRSLVFVRTKADLGVRAIARRTGKRMLEASKILRQQVNASFKENAEKCGLGMELSNCKLFILSAWALMENAYVNGNDRSLEFMDEKECLEFVSSAVNYRA